MEDSIKLFEIVHVPTMLFLLHQSILLIFIEKKNNKCHSNFLKIISSLK